MARAAELTTPDLVVLALLAEGPRHGHDVDAELRRRDVADWAAISRPQVYYSLRKLAERALIEPDDRAQASAGPERQVWRLRAGGREALATGLADEGWARHRPPPPFLTWLALSPHAPAGTVSRLVAARRAFLGAEITRERETAAALAALADGPGVVAARLMVDLTVRQFEQELTWLDEVEAAFAPQAPSAPRNSVRREFPIPPRP